jgi:phage terminase small subunit
VLFLCKKKELRNVLSLKQQKFCEYYVELGNATEAAKKAGYSEKTAYSQGQRMLKNVEIQKYVNELAVNAKDNRRKKSV